MAIRTVATRVDWPRTSVERSLAWFSFFAFWAVAAAAVASGKDGLVNGLQVAWWWTLAPIVTAVLAAGLPLVRARRQVPITIDRDGVVVGGRIGGRTLSNAQITSGYVVSGKGSSVLSLSLRDGSIVQITFAARGNAADALVLLGLTAAERRATIPLASPDLRYARALLWAAGHGVMMMVVLGILGRAGIDPVVGLEWAAFAAFTGFFFMRGSRLPEVEVGLDAITVRAAFERTTLDVAEIIAVDRMGAASPGDLDAPDCVNLTLKGGAVLTMRVHRGAPAPSLGEAIKLRIDEARAARAALVGSPDIKQLGRRGRPFEAWRNDVAALASPASVYRAAGLLFADLARVVADPDAPPEQRIGAALALGKDRGRVRREAVRVAARACLEPKLRIALSETLREHPDEATILAALSEAETEAEAEAVAGPDRAAFEPPR